MKYLRFLLAVRGTPLTEPLKPSGQRLAACPQLDWTTGRSIASNVFNIMDVASHGNVEKKWSEHVFPTR